MIDGLKNLAFVHLNPITHVVDKILWKNPGTWISNFSTLMNDWSYQPSDLFNCWF